uniref:YqaJ viral recombinase domain-containing protein n=1 Tax=viral metagenome TaxID=1070528 RepID=A0A6M3L7R3_9ZZZZ
MTDRQKERLAELLARQNDADAKPLTAKMKTEVEALVASRDAQFAFGATALSYIRDCWLRNEYGYDEPVMTNEMLKGLLCEEEAIGVLSRQVEGEFRVKNEQTWENAWFVGTPDVVGADVVEDVKCSWTLRTFMEVQHPSALYFAQGQVYMDLTGRDKFRLCHVLVATPLEIVMEEQKRFYFRFNCDESNHHYLECVRKVESMHAASGLLPEEDRIKVFEFERNDIYLMKLRKRVEQARVVYRTLTLRGDNDG